MTSDPAPAQLPEGGPAVDVEETTIDLTDRALSAEEAGFREVVDQAPVGLLVTDLDGVVGFANAALGELAGREPADLVGRADLAPIHPADRQRIVAAVERLRRSGRMEIIDCRLGGPDLESRPVRTRLGLLREPGGEPVGIVATISDHSDVEHRATHDELTGLPNRTLLGAHLGDALDRAERDGTTLGVLLVGLDRLQVVTDALGHRAGDRVIRQAARRLAVAVGSGDLVGRFSEDRFVVVKEAVGGVDAAARLAARLVHAVERVVSVDGDEAVVGASVGIALSTPGESTVDQLVRDADVAMARARSGTSPRFEVFDPEMRSWVEARRALEIALRRSIEHDELELAYQPIVAVADRALRGFEALARWNHPELGRRSPAEFIPVAEESGLIVPLGEALISRVCHQLAAWQRVDPSIFVSVNLSARQLVDDGLIDSVAAALDQSGAAPAGLHLEITETVLVTDVDAAAASLEALRGLGVRLCLDDFGTGYSSLTYLSRLPIDVVKIDRSFVTALGTSPRDTSVVATIIGMARTLGHGIVAEGVETDDQLGRLAALGCEMAQGYLFAEARPAGEVDLGSDY